MPWAKFILSLSECLLWGVVVTPAVLWYSWRVPLIRARWRKAPPFHLAACLGVCALLVVPGQLLKLLISRAAAEPDLYQPFSLAVFSRLFVSEGQDLGARGGQGCRSNCLWSDCTLHLIDEESLRKEFVPRLLNRKPARKLVGARSGAGARLWADGVRPPEARCGEALEQGPPSAS